MALDGLSVFERGTLPNWLKVRQQLYAAEIADIDAAVAEQFQRPEIDATIKPGMRVAVGAGSRGIDRIDQTVKATVDQVKLRGGEPFVFPAMGSHGGATPEGQKNLLDHYGINEATMGCPIKATMDTVSLGIVEDDCPVYFDRIAYEEADAVIPVCRVKPHTDFYGPIESGLMKMIAIGMGKQKGADTFHSRGFPDFHTLIPAVGLSTLSHVNIPFGVAIVENGYGHSCIIEAVPAKGMLEREKELLKLAREWLGRLPGEKIDVLLVDEIGKNISGDGADPNVINRDVSGEILKNEIHPKPEIHRVIFRDLTADTEGNATGVGLGRLRPAPARRQVRSAFYLYERHYVEISGRRPHADGGRQRPPGDLSRDRQRPAHRSRNRQDRPHQEHQGCGRVLDQRTAVAADARIGPRRSAHRPSPTHLRRTRHAGRLLGSPQPAPSALHMASSRSPLPRGEGLGVRRVRLPKNLLFPGDPLGTPCRP